MSQLPLQLDVTMRLISGNWKVNTNDMHQFHTDATNLLCAIFALSIHQLN